MDRALRPWATPDARSTFWASAAEAPSQRGMITAQPAHEQARGMGGLACAYGGFGRSLTLERTRCELRSMDQSTDPDRPFHPAWPRSLLKKSERSFPPLASRERRSLCPRGVSKSESILGATSTGSRGRASPASGTDLDRDNQSSWRGGCRALFHLDCWTSRRLSRENRALFRQRPRPARRCTTTPFVDPLRRGRCCPSAHHRCT